MALAQQRPPFATPARVAVRISRRASPWGSVHGWSENSSRPRRWHRPIYHWACRRKSHLLPVPAEFRRCGRGWGPSVRAGAGSTSCLIWRDARCYWLWRRVFSCAQKFALSPNLRPRPALPQQAAPGPGESLCSIASSVLAFSRDSTAPATSLPRALRRNDTR